MTRIYIYTLFIIISALCVKADSYYPVNELQILGSAASDSTNLFTRLPQSLRDHIKPELCKLGNNTAGMSIRFASDATKISARWTNRYKTSMNHMCPTGIRGLDLYMLMPDNTWAFVGSARPNLNDATSTSTFIQGLKGDIHEYMLFLPLYDGITDLEIGVNAGAQVYRPEVELPQRDLPIVMYGTSILQGGCATRPGMAHTNILQRLLNREVINLGFSGNGHLQPEIAKFMADIDAGLYVIDVLPNNTAASLNQKLGPFYNILRAAHPNTPILLVESPFYPRCKFDRQYRASISALNKTLKNFYDERRAQGDSNIYYFEGDEIMDIDCEGSIDGVHFTDLAFQNFADVLYRKILNILHLE